MSLLDLAGRRGLVVGEARQNDLVTIDDGGAAAAGLVSDVAALGGGDGRVFSAGIGEDVAPVREPVREEAAWPGIRRDRAPNPAGGPRITTAESAVSAWVVPTDEEVMIARHARPCIRA